MDASTILGVLVEEVLTLSLARMHVVAGEDDHYEVQGNKGRYAYSLPGQADTDQSLPIGSDVPSFPIQIVNSDTPYMAVQIYVCKDEENTLAKLRWYCDPDDMGTAQCYKEAGGHNGKALGIHVRSPTLINA